MPDELSDRLGARTVSRLVEICGSGLLLDGNDDRTQYPFDRSEFSRSADTPGLYIE
jgi:hypothetical protein